MAERLLGYGTTDSNGIAVLNLAPDGETSLEHSYTGVGAGKLNIVARTSDDNLQSEVYELEDCLWWDDMTSDRTEKYYYNNSSGTTFAYDSTNKKYVVTCGSNANQNMVYLRSDMNNVGTNQFKGKRVQFSVQFEGATSSKGLRIRCSQVYGGSTHNETYVTVTSDGTFSTPPVEIDLNATRVSFEIAPTYSASNPSINWEQGSTYTIKNWKVIVV